MTADLAHATPWGATHHHTDLGGDVHWIHWDAPERGVDATPMVLVHGLGGSHTNWLEVGQMWSQHREVFALDLRGFGLTAGHPADTAVLANRDLVVAFLVVNVAVLAVMATLSATAVGVGVGLGLFGVL